MNYIYNKYDVVVIEQGMQAVRRLWRQRDLECIHLYLQ